MLDAIAERAARLCNSIDAQILSLDDAGHRAVASYGPISVTPRQERVPLDRGSVAGRSMLDRQTIYVHDILNTPVSEYPRARELAQRHGKRTVLSTPLLRRGVPIGAILLRRIEARLLQSGDQVTGNLRGPGGDRIENARLFQELTKKSTELEFSNSELREPLEQQTATSEILESSPAHRRTFSQCWNVAEMLRGCAVQRMLRSIVSRVNFFVEWLLMAQWLRPTK